jgi:hypothetical protein
MKKENVPDEPKVFEDSQVPYHDEPEQNEFERSKANSNGYDQSGMA